jgi:FkbM family methyltransferase
MPQAQGNFGIGTPILCRLIATVSNWPVYFWNKFGWTGEEVQYKLRNGMTFVSRKHAIDGSCLNEVWFDKSYDPTAFDIPFDWSKAKTIIDIGGNIGTFTVFAAAKSPQAHIITLEPEPSNFQVLSKNVQNNHLQSRITLIKAGIGDGKPQTLFTFASDPGGNSAYRGAEGGTPVEMQTKSLQQIFDQYKIEMCDYLKIDCEGGEYEALYALPNEYFGHIKCIGLEYHHFSKDPRHTSAVLEEFLIKQGFRVIRHKKSMLFALR